MKYLFLVLAIFLAAPLLHAQTAVEYTYDNAGNRIQRKVPPVANLQEAVDTTNAATLPQSKLVTTSPTDYDIQISPNPTAGKLQIRLPQDIQRAELEIYDLSGALLLKQPLRGLDTNLDIGKYAAGLYLVTIRGTDFQATWRLVKQ